MTGDGSNARVFWSCAALGGGAMAFGVAGLLSEAGPGVTDTKPLRWLGWLVAVLVVHDGIVVPTTLLVGRGVRLVPALLRTPLQVGLALTAIVALLGVPLLREPQVQQGNTSILPGDYPAALATVVALVWLFALGLGAARWRRSHDQEG